MYIAPSILAADFARLGEEIESVNDADIIHFDVMDGRFVPNISFGIPVLESVRRVTDKTLDVHLMIEEPQNYAGKFCKAGANIVTFHVESCSAEIARQTLRDIRSYRCTAGLAIKPSTTLDLLLPLLPDVDIILVMTVEPGFSGQQFMYDQLDRIAELKRIINSRGLAVLLEVDGGINPETARLCREYGVKIAVAGNAVFALPPGERNMRIDLMGGETTA